MTVQKVKVMVSLRRVVLASSVSSVLALAAASCSDDERPRYEPSGGDAEVDSGSPKPLPEASTWDSSVDDAADAGDIPDEPVVCESEPCAVDIVAGRNHFCVLMSDKTARCWGDDSFGQLGAGKTPSLDEDGGPPPVRAVVDVTNATQISAGGATSCALLSSGTVTCWGGNDQAQLGLNADPAASDGAPHPVPSAVALPKGSTASRVDVGLQTACAVLVNNDVFCWGANDQAQLGRPATWSPGGPAKVEALTGKVTRTTAGMHTAFAVDDVGRIMSWGGMADVAGILSGRVSSLNPDLVPAFLGVEGVTSVAASAWHSEWTGMDQNFAHACLIARGSAYCWGESQYGAMGFGVPFAFKRPTLVTVRSDARPQRVAVSLENTCLRMSDGSIQCAGDDARGQLGRGADAGFFSDFFTPATELKEHALRLALSDTTACVIVRGGKVMCWGGNAHGELGQGTIDDGAHPTPTSVKF